MEKAVSGPWNGTNAKSSVFNDVGILERVKNAGVLLTKQHAKKIAITGTAKFVKSRTRPKSLFQKTMRRPQWQCYILRVLQRKIE